MNIYLHRFLLVAAVLGPAPFIQAEPKPVRLYEIFAVRITQDGSGIQTIERGRLNALGKFTVVEFGAFPGGVTAPADALNRLLITTQTWVAYDMLGADAFANFETTGGIITIGSQGYFPVAVSPEAKLDVGEMVNISTRATVTPGADPVIGGFYIADTWRRVLIRGIGPGLADFDVANPLPDPYITLYKGSSTIGQGYNDNWEERHDAAEIVRVSAEIGAFPLKPGSKDAAYLVELPPGAYTVHLTTFAGTGGNALLEIYVLP